MIRFWLGLVAAIFILSVVPVANCKEKKNKISPDDYLVWPKINYGKDNFHARVRSALKRLVDENWISRDMDYKAKSRRIIEASGSEKFSQEEREIYLRFLMMAAYCIRGSVNMFQSVWVQLQDKMIPDEFRSLVDVIGTSTFSRCSPVRKRLPVELDSQLDKVFAAAFNKDFHEGSFSELSLFLTAALSEFDFATSSFNAKEMVATMRKLTSDEEAKIAEPFDLAKKFMLTRCDQFDEELKLTIVIEDLARKFGKLGAKSSLWLVERMDEYNRLCVALRSAEKQEVISKNLLAQLSDNELEDLWRNWSE